MERKLAEAKALLAAQMVELRGARAGPKPILVLPHAPTPIKVSSTLPDGWKRATDPVSKREYFYNKAMGCSQFDYPTAESSPPLPPPPPPPPYAPDKLPPLMLHPPEAAASTALVVHTERPAEGSRSCQAARLRAMMPFLDGPQRAYTAGELAVLEFIERS